jgi:hypothetical protein
VAALQFEDYELETGSGAILPPPGSEESRSDEDAWDSESESYADSEGFEEGFEDGGEGEGAGPGTPLAPGPGTALAPEAGTPLAPEAGLPGPWALSAAVAIFLSQLLTGSPGVADPGVVLAPSGPWAADDLDARNIAGVLVGLLWNPNWHTRVIATATLQRSLAACEFQRQGFAVMLAETGCLGAVTNLIRGGIAGTDVEWIACALVTLFSEALCDPVDPADTVAVRNLRDAQAALAKFCLECVRPGIALAWPYIGVGMGGGLAECACRAVLKLSREQPGLMEWFVAAGGFQRARACLVPEDADKNIITSVQPGVPASIVKASALRLMADMLRCSPETPRFLEQAAAGGMLEWAVSLLESPAGGGQCHATTHPPKSLPVPDFISQPAFALVSILV